jgi:predicted ATPase
MITKWKVFNFKSISRETELQIAPLTIFAGVNSSGKSTFLQSILLVAQTLANKVSSRSVVLNGALSKLGQFDDLKSVGGSANQIVVGWTCKPIQDPQTTGIRMTGFRRVPTVYGRTFRTLSSVSCEIGFDTEESGALREVTQIQPRLFSSVVSTVTRDADGSDRPYSISIRRATSADTTAKHRWTEAIESENSLVRTSLQYEVELDDASLVEIHEELASAESIGCILRHFLPEQIALGIDLVPETATVIINTLLGEGPRAIPRRPFVDREAIVPGVIVDYVSDVAKSSRETELPQMLHSLRQPTLFDKSAMSLESFLDAFRRISPRARMNFRRQVAEDREFEDLVNTAVRKDRHEDLDVVLYRIPSGIAEACRYLDQFFATSVRYLGPLRDEPKSLYPLSPTVDPSDVGLKGEYTAAVLDLHKNRPVRYIPTSAFARDEIAPNPITRTLEAAVVDWLQYLGVAESIESHDKGKFGHELVVSIAGGKRPHDLTHVGVGVSQVLPILVASLLAEPDTTLIFEQPELHLHPRVQTLLADFFLSMTQLGKQCVIETHSEYIVNRIRFRSAAAKKTNPWIEAIKVYFVERDTDGSSFREVRINEYGAIVDWPDGFFDQSQSEAEAILRAAAAKKRTQRTQ